MAKEKKEEIPIEETKMQAPEMPAEPTEIPSSEQMLRKHLKLKEGDDIHQHALSQLQELGKYKNQNEGINQKLIDAFENNPEFAQATKEIVAGVPAHIAIARHIDMESLTPKEGDDDYEEFQKAISENKKSKAEKQKYLKNMEDNIKMSAKQVEEFAKENKLSDEEAENFLKNVDELVSDMVKGKVTKEALNTFYKGMKRDEDVAEAKEAGKVEGKNEKIEAQKEKEDAAKGDGLPNLEAQNKVKEPAKAKLSSWEEAMIAEQNKRKR